MIDVQKIYTGNEPSLIAVITLPDTNELVDYVFTVGVADTAPIHIELLERYDAGEFNDIMEPEPAPPPMTIEEVRAQALAQLSSKIRATEDRILGRVPKTMRVDFSDSLQLVGDEADCAEYLQDVQDQLATLTVADGE